MVKKILLFILIAIIATGCTWVNPEKDKQADGAFQKDEEVTDEELIRYNLYSNPTEYYEQKNLERTMDNSNENTSDSEGPGNKTERQIYYELMQLEEVRQAGLAITEDKIYIAINLENRSEPKETVKRVKDIVEKITGRSDIIVDVDPDYYDSRIE
ncbi:YhcN/YlaJ family sporulation lipoprotein [Allobacillus sp. GCM10007491]|uniref:YhcN/YlaJ family sporulation lipoprotein n=1 Tax=Allobacillus saliphilus TaxID=2912308 RepID=A0A941CT90_9BACI|nr:YhcN/YlaJ family sporulation lipoprotein [Allobacillus saliphilus]MBR7553407.1 YhcN/YlaJ family sporulation lipoprotein [Allobacillus saliphilus]